VCELEDRVRAMHSFDHPSPRLSLIKSHRRRVPNLAVHKNRALPGTCETRADGSPLEPGRSGRALRGSQPPSGNSHSTAQTLLNTTANVAQTLRPFVGSLFGPFRIPRLSCSSSNVGGGDADLGRGTVFVCLAVRPDLEISFPAAFRTASKARLRRSRNSPTCRILS
jgi:hypothetical protein